MKKITLNLKRVVFAFTLFIATAGYSQDLLYGFEPGESGSIGESFPGAAIIPVIETGTGTNTTKVLKIVGNPAIEPWQGVNLTLSSAVNLTTTKTMTMDVWSATPITFLVKVSNGVAPAAVSAASASHPGGSVWQTVSFTFTSALDGQPTPANGIYTGMVIHTYWAPGAVGFFNPTVPTPARTFYVDNIKGPFSAPPVIPTPATAAPVPTFPNSQVYSIYNDTNNYTTTFPVQYSFGSLSAEPDLDPSPTVVNKAYRFNFGIAGWGQGEAMANVTPYGFVAFDYWAQPGLPNGFRFVLISNSGSVQERFYQIGTNEPLVTGQWKRVEIPMSHFTSGNFAATNFFQWKVSPFGDSVDNAGFVYVDNIMFTVNSILGTDSFNKLSVKMYPNPSNGILNISSENTIENITIYNTLGQLVTTQMAGNNKESIDVSSLPNGVYILSAQIGGETIRKQFIKE